MTGPSLPLSWQPFRGASAYFVHVWLVKADAGQTITAHTVGTTARTVTGTRVSIPTAGMPKGLYQWNVAAVSASGQLLAGWGTPRSVQLE